LKRGFKPYMNCAFFFCGNVVARYQCGCTIERFFLLDGVSKKEMNEKKKKEEEGEGKKKARAMVEQLEMMGKGEWERETAN
jgi:hypothetical protein